MRAMHWKKLIAPIIITIIVISILIVQLVIFISMNISMWVKVVVCIGLIALGGAMIFVLCERIKEIRSGDEDDLGKY
jgi:hypothetical protein